MEAAVKPRHQFDCRPDNPTPRSAQAGPPAFTRRRFVQAALSLPPVLALPACGQERPQPVKITRTFFTRDEYRFVEAAVARLIPGDDEDPGAVQAQVPFFIDLQLAGPYGRADAWYMAGPWEEGSEQQGWQLKENPAQLYRKGIAALDDYCREHHDGKVFADLSEDLQDKVLHDLDKKKIELQGISATAFFNTLWQNTQEGFLADPMYGGNRNFVGWELIGFPGPRYNYVEEVTQYGEPYPYPTVGILGRDGTRVSGDA